MASTTTGERRWASSKKGGMTVLGKVAVPKPINLPSQRLENHGLDPNVELVPKGSLSWGARSSSSGSNAWGSSALSPNTEGVSASPSHLSGRPSSGGGTRPSTAGSERTSDSVSSEWTSNSRPSSASGILASSNALMELRPRSAETRPGSSQMSRFAEPLRECRVAQVASGSADQMGIAASSNDGFSLSSGDFPTLGSENNSGQNRESLGHNYNDRPGSASGLQSATTEKMEGVPDDASRPSDIKSGMVDYWRNDGPQHVEDGHHPGIEKWHVDPYSYPNPNNSPQFYENWRGGAPLNPPSEVWFRVPPGAPPYGAPPMEPFPYYHPQVPAPGANNSQTDPPRSSVPCGPHSKSGDLCRPTAKPTHPGMPIRPGFYPGYYGPPMGFWNPNEQDYTFMGVPAGLDVHKRYPNLNVPESSISSVISCEGRTLEQVEHGPPHDSQRCYSASVKQNKGREREEASSLLLEDKIDSKDPSYVKVHGSSSRGESVNMKPFEENVALPRDHRLMKKIEGSNSKAQALDRRHDFHREESHYRGQVVDPRASYPVNGANTGIHLVRHYPSGILVPVASDMTMLAEDKGFGSTTGHVTAISRHSSHNVQTRGDNGGKGRFNRQETDGWREKSTISGSPVMVLVVNPERTTNIQGQQQPIALQSTEMPLSDGEMMDGSSDSQRAKKKEIANQRAMKLQKEEEEGIIEQKAKAFINQSKETRVKADSVPYHADVMQKKKESKIKIELQFGSIQSEEMAYTSAHSCSPSKARKAVESNLSSGVSCSQTNQHVDRNDSVLAADGDCISGVAGPQNVEVCRISRQKRAADYKQEPNVSSGKSSTDKRKPEAKDKSDTIVTVLNETVDKGVSSSLESNTPVDLPIAADSLLQPKRKNTRVGKNKHKVDNSFATSSTLVQKEPCDDAQCRDNNTWKPQHARNMPRHTQARPVEKSHSSDAVVWAPVKSQNETETTDENDQKAEGSVSSLRSFNAVPSSSKGKRADMERYVPKAAIREPAQQGSGLQKTDGSGNKSSVNHTKNSQAFDVLQRTHKVEELPKGSAAKQDKEPAKKHSQQAGEINQGIADDGWNIVDDEPVSSGIVSGAKDHETFGRGKRNPYKEHRGIRKQKNIDHENHSYAEADADRLNSSKGKNVAQWQPKHHTHTSFDGGLHLKQHTSQESLVGRKAAASKDHASSSNKDNVVEVESARVRHTNRNNTDQHPSSSGNHKNGTYNGRFSRGHEFRGDPSFTAQDNRHNYAPTNWETRRQNSQYEYRPVGPYKRGGNSEGQSVNQPVSE